MTNPITAEDAKKALLILGILIATILKHLGALLMAGAWAFAVGLAMLAILAWTGVLSELEGVLLMGFAAGVAYLPAYRFILWDFDNDID